MAKASALPTWQRAFVLLTGTVVAVVVFACLYWAQTIFIPVALAIFLTFLLSPVVTILQRRGLGRVPSVAITVLLGAAVLGVVGWVMTREVVAVVNELPQYTDNIKTKIRTLREMTQGTQASRLQEFFDAILNEITGQPTKEGEASKPPEQAAGTTPAGTPSLLSRLPTTLSSLPDMLGGFLLTLVLLVFMLLKREDLRNRLIRLAGNGRITVTTKAVDEAGQRISRFLVMQAIINAAVGLTLAIGLSFIGFKHAILWGMLAAMMRYIPYLGIWLAALPVILLSLAQFEGWPQPLMVIGLILVTELVTGNFVEPRLYGKSIGVSEVALLVSAAFWYWMWGPIGMVLSSPLTVVMVVLGKYVPHLSFLDVLLGDEPALEPNITFYQRLLAHDQDEAEQLVLTQAKESQPDQVYDELLVPALNYSKRDRERDDLTEADEQYILRATEEIIEDLGERLVKQAQQVENAKTEAEKAPASPGPEQPRMRILALPARDEADRLSLEMLQHLLDPAKWEVEIASAEAMTTDLLALAIERKPALICIASLPPGGLAHTRYLCKRLRTRLPEAKLVVGRWGLKGNVEDNTTQLREAGADEVETTLLEMRQRLTGWLPVLQVMEEKSPADGVTKERPKPATGNGAKTDQKLVKTT